MNEDMICLKSKFDEVEKMGWLEAPNNGNYGIIGRTFETLIGLPMNELEIPDFGNIEIKTKSNGNFDYIDLFNCVPTGPHFHEVERIKDTFGYPDSVLKEFKVFNGDVFGNKIVKTGSKFYFKINVNRETQNMISKRIK